MFYLIHLNVNFHYMYITRYNLEGIPISVLYNIALRKALLIKKLIQSVIFMASEGSGMLVMAFKSFKQIITEDFPVSVIKKIVSCSLSIYTIDY